MANHFGNLLDLKTCWQLWCIFPGKRQRKLNFKPIKRNWIERPRFNHWRVHIFMKCNKIPPKKNIIQNERRTPLTWTSSFEWFSKLHAWLAYFAGNMNFPPDDDDASKDSIEHIFVIHNNIERTTERTNERMCVSKKFVICPELGRKLRSVFEFTCLVELLKSGSLCLTCNR